MNRLTQDSSAIPVQQEDNVVKKAQIFKLKLLINNLLERKMKVENLLRKTTLNRSIRRTSKYIDAVENENEEA